MQHKDHIKWKIKIYHMQVDNLKMPKHLVLIMLTMILLFNVTFNPNQTINKLVDFQDNRLNRIIKTK